MTTSDAPSLAAPAPLADRAPADRDAAPQYVLPLVVRIERAVPPGPPARADALETAARAVLALLSDERTADPGGDWHPLVRAWQDGRIRKVVRRARGAEWRRVQALPGLTVTGSGAVDAEGAGSSGSTEGTRSTAPAEVRVFPPVPLDGWPKELARLQVSGTELTDPAPPAAPAPGTPVLWLNPALEMSAGKAMAQAGHGAQFVWWALDDGARTAWRAAGFPLAVRTAPPGRWAELTAAGLPVVRDAGFTEIAPGSATVVADHPALRR
ncbi:peptidyl-tRNA hydrolase [Streptomyces carminius]|uniref:peptidyl-tRNA hydrolase n=1 Tax=Streptomyces carminius TaxID=2665496 RepID=A0A2M8LPD9_9ACTN|nr:peptidyl-tRNA hydrolase [Streptomyces carminius]PJE93824.1 peptidyl-tRNA hydrolase [Streptomyces carminius]